MTDTNIEWADKSWNPIRAHSKATGRTGHFCIHASDGCKFCYAEEMNNRFGTRIDYTAQNADSVDIYLCAKTLVQPLKWRKPKTIFPCSMTDLFGEFVSDALITQVVDTMAKAPQHRFIVVTKRAERMERFMHAYGTLPNMMLCVSVESKREALRRIPFLLTTPAALRGISFEPLLDDVTDVLHDLRWLDWAVIGGESGPHARPCHLDWIRGVARRCQAHGVATFVKQLGAKPEAYIGGTNTAITLHDAKGGDPDEWPADIRVREAPPWTR